MDLGLEGKVALVVGASKGIGRAIAAELVAEGARVAIASRSAERIGATAKAIGATGFVWDTSEPETASSLLADTEEQLGPIDILVCNTGGPPVQQDPLAATTEQWRQAYASLVLAPIELTRLALPAMRERGWGRVLNVVSAAAREPNPALILSNAHRSATLAAWKTLAGEFAPGGVTINSLLPGMIDTDRLRENFGSIDAMTAQIPAKRLGTVEEMAAAAAFLCSTRASYITGVALLVDGGVTRAV